jgi:hypothetical protein
MFQLQLGKDPPFVLAPIQNISIGGLIGATRFSRAEQFRAE